MTSRLKGRTLEEVRAVAADVRELLTGPDEGPADLEKLGDLAALQGVRKYAVRVKCATLAWHALEAALAGRSRNHHGIGSRLKDRRRPA